MREIKYRANIAHKSSVRREVKRKRFTIIAILILVIAVSYTLALRSPYLFVRSVLISGNNAVPEISLRARIGDTLSGFYGNLISKKNIIFVPKEEMAASLMSAYPRLSDAQVSSSGIFNLSVDVKERSPAYAYCASADAPKGGEDCFVSDENGYIFEPYKFSPGTYLVFFDGFSGGGATSTKGISTQIIPAADFRVVTGLRDGIEKLGIPVYAASFGDDSDVFFWLKDSTGKNSDAKIEMNYKKDPWQTLSNLNSALLADPLKSKMANSRDKLFYIDVRFGNKVFFKFRD